MSRGGWDRKTTLWVISAPCKSRSWQVAGTGSLPQGSEPTQPPFSYTLKWINNEKVTEMSKMRLMGWPNIVVMIKITYYMIMTFTIWKSVNEKGKVFHHSPKIIFSEIVPLFPRKPRFSLDLEAWNPWTTINFDNLSQPGKGARPTSNANDKSFDDDDDDIILNSTQM